MSSWFGREPKPAPAIAAGDLEIGQPWGRLSVRMPLHLGGFFVVVNKGATPDRLLAASSPLADKVEIHAIKVAGADIRMLAVDKGLVVEAGGTLTLKPRGYHLLLSGMARPPAVGGQVPVTLRFEKAGKVDIKLAMAAPGLVGEEILDDEAHRG